MPTSTECSPAQTLLERFDRDPEGVFVVFEDDSRWTNSQAVEEMRQLAARFRALGVNAGETVALWQPNGANMLRALLACSMLGVTASLINIALKGNTLSHALNVGDARLLYGHGTLIARLEKEALGTVETLFSSEPTHLDRRDVTVRMEDTVPCDTTGVAAGPTEPWFIPVIVFTSGTTGESKGVRVTAGQLWTLGKAHYGFLQESDRILLMLPLFHIASLGGLYGALAANASVSVMESFRPADFQAVIRHTSSTATVGMNDAWMNMIAKAQPPAPDDPGLPLRITLVTSVTSIGRAFAERFGCDLFAAYGMSEASGIAISEINPAKNGSVGRLRKGLEGRLVDAWDVPVKRSEPGELIIRASLPWMLNDGYFANAAATVKAWRNGWFHTGDTFVEDEDGDLFFLDRNKDVIRRQGENISSIELEREIRVFDQVRDAAAIGIADDTGSEEVLAVIEPIGEFRPDALIEFLAERVPHFMVPRYVRVVESLPRTATSKVTKVELREEGLKPGDWDREAAGIRIRRQKLTERG